MNVEPPGNVSAAALNGVSLAGLGTGPLFLTSGVPSMVNTPQQGQIALAAQAGPSQYSSTYDHLDGARWVSAGSATSAALLVVNSMDQPEGVIKSISVDISSLGDGTMALVLLLDNGDGTMNVMAKQAITTGSTGTVTFNAGIDFPIWNVTQQNKIGIQSTATGAFIRYASSGGSGYRVFIGTASGVGVNMTTTPPSTTGNVFYSVTTTVKEPVPYGQCILAKNSFPLLPAGWVNGGGWSFSSSSRAATSSTTGNTNQLREGFQYGLDQRTVTWVFSIGTVADILGFITNPIEGGSQLGTLVRVNGTSGAIEIMTTYNGSSLPTTVLSSVTFAPAANTQYMAVWNLNGHTQTFSVYTLAGVLLATITRTVPLPLSAGPTYNFDMGYMNGAPGVVVISGSASVYKYSHVANTAERPFLYIGGDSITNEFCVPYGQGYGSLLRADMGKYNVAISGVGGAVATGLTSRMGKEILCLKPRNILIYIGTNSSSDMAAYIPYIVALARGIGANVYLCGNPKNATSNTVVFAQPAYALTVDFAAVLCISGVSGTPLITALYNNLDVNGNVVNDNIHPGPSGHLVMKNQIYAQIPALQNVTP